MIQPRDQRALPPAQGARPLDLPFHHWPSPLFFFLWLRFHLGLVSFSFPFSSIIGIEESLLFVSLVQGEGKAISSFS